MKFIPYIKIVLLVACAIAFIAGVATYDSENAKVVTSGLNFMFNFSAALILLTALAAIVMPIVGIIQNPKNSLKSLIGLAVIVVVFLISYLMSSDEPIKVASGQFLDNSADLKFSDTALYATYIAFSGVLVSIVVGEIYKLFK